METNDRKKSRIRFKQINLIVDELLRKMPPTAALLMVVAWRDADTRGRWSMSKRQIAEVMGLSARHVSATIQQLIKLGAIRVLKKETGRRPPIYMLTFKVEPVGMNCGSSLETTHNHIEGRTVVPVGMNCGSRRDEL